MQYLPAVLVDEVLVCGGVAVAGKASQMCKAWKARAERWVSGGKGLQSLLDPSVGSPIGLLHLPLTVG